MYGYVMEGSFDRPISSCLSLISSGVGDNSAIMWGEFVML